MDTGTVTRWRCAEGWCGARWEGSPEAGYPHPPVPDVDPERDCLICGADIIGNDPHAPGCPADDAGAVRVEVVALAVMAAGALYVLAHVAAWAVEVARTAGGALT